MRTGLFTGRGWRWRHLSIRLLWIGAHRAHLLLPGHHSRSWGSSTPSAVLHGCHLISLHNLLHLRSHLTTTDKLRMRAWRSHHLWIHAICEAVLRRQSWLHSAGIKAYAGGWRAALLLHCALGQGGARKPLRAHSWSGTLLHLIAWIRRGAGSAALGRH